MLFKKFKKIFRMKMLFESKSKNKKMKNEGIYNNNNLEAYHQNK